MRIAAISDLHGMRPKLHGGDLLLVGGDVTASDKLEEWESFFIWLSQQNYRKKILIGGNHDSVLQKTNPFDQIKPLIDIDPNVFEYLCDSGTEFEGLKIWGSPWTRRFHNINPNCCAFTVSFYQSLADKWALIPEDTDILMTHTPPFGKLDKIWDGSRQGDKCLANRLLQLKNLKLHVFGHIHEGYGKCHQAFDKDNVPIGHLSVNAAHMNAYYDSDNPPIYLDI